MSDVTLAPQQNDAPGEVIAKTLRSRGYNDDEVTELKGQLSNVLSQRNYNEQEIKDFWGYKDPNMKPLQDQIKNNVQQATQKADGSPGDKVPPSSNPTQPKDIWDALKMGWGIGWDRSDLGLIKNGSYSEQNIPDDQHAMAVAAGASQFLGDLPFAGAGFAGMGLPGAFALPQMVRKFIVDEYQKGNPVDTKDLINRIVAVGTEGAKGFATGLATELTGGVANIFGGKLAQLGAEVGAQTVVSNALEKKVPTMNEFINSGILIGGLHAVGTVTPKIMNVWKATGEEPGSIVERTKVDPAFHGEIASEDPSVPEEARPEENVELKAGQSVLDEGTKAPPPAAEEPSKTGAAPEQTPYEKARQEILSRQEPDEEPTKDGLLNKIKAGTLSRYQETVEYLNGKYRSVFDKSAILKDLIDTVGRSKLAGENSYYYARAFADIGSKVEHFFNNGTVDPETNSVNGEGLAQILDEYRNKFPQDQSLDDLKAHLMANHALELDARGIKQIGDRANDQIAVEARPDLDPFAKRIVGFENRVLNYARGKGLLSDESYNNMVKKNLWYLPFQKIAEADQSGGGSKLGSLKQIGDSLKQIKDPMRQLVLNTEMLIRAADENFIKRQAHLDMQKADNPEDMFQEVSKQTKVTNIGGDRIAEALKKQGIDLSNEDVDTIKLFTKSDIPKGDDIFWYRDQGKIVAIKTIHPDVAEVLNSYSNNYAGMSVFTRMLRTAAVAARFGTIQNPLTMFFLRHPARNIQQAFVFSKTGFGLMDVLKTYAETAKDKTFLNQAALDGALVSSIDKTPEAYYTDEMQNLDKKAPFFKRAWNLVDNALSFSHAVIIHTDNMIRMTEYKKALEQGKSRPEAALLARDVLPDFQKQGLEQSFLQSTTAFFKAHYQGQFQMVGALSDKKEAMGALAKNLGYITVPSFLLYMAQRNNQRINDLKGYARDGYWNFQNDSWRDASLDEYNSRKQRYDDEVRIGANGQYQINDGYIFKFPKPFANGELFGSIFEEAMRSIDKKDPSQFGEFLGRVADTMFLNPIPTIGKPMLEQAMNRNMYSGTQLVRADTERRLPEDRYSPYTTEFSKWLGTKIAAVPGLRNLGPRDAPLAAPPVLDNYMQTFTGGSWKYMSQFMDKYLMGKNNVPPPDYGWEDVPGVREWFYRHNMESQEVVNFNEMALEASEIENSIKFLASHGNPERAMKLQNQYNINFDRMSGYRASIRNMQTMIYRIQNAPSPQSDPRGGLTSVQKRQFIDGLTDQIVGLARQGNKEADEFEKLMKGTK